MRRLLAGADILEPTVPVPPVPAVVVPVIVNVLSPRGVPDVVAMLKVSPAAPVAPGKFGKIIPPKLGVVPAGAAVKLKVMSVGNPVLVEPSSKVTVVAYISLVSPRNTVLSPDTDTV